jgi:adenine/guanine phosphoribosyltransferase-like PRPP-binding protein
MNLPDKCYDQGCAEHLKYCFYDRRKRHNLAKKSLKLTEFDTIVVTGISGIAFGSILSFLLKKQLVIVRKGGERAHSSRKVESNITGKNIGKWVFVDDLIDTGKTLKRVKRSLEDGGYFGIQVATYLYNYDELRTIYVKA